MAAGVRGRLVSAAFADTTLASLPGAEAPPPVVVHDLEAWVERRDASLGPASSVRAVADGAVIPLLKILGYAVERRLDEPSRVILEALTPSSAAVPVVIVPWNESLERAWRSVVLEGVRADARWCFCANAVSLRMVDAHQTWSRHYIEFDLSLASRDGPARMILWSLARAQAMSGSVVVLDRASELSARHGAAVCKALGDGVLHALELLISALSSSVGHSSFVLFDQSLTVLYRVLFLLFAEARGLVPMWHPVYRDRYSIDAIVTTLLAGRPYRGIWHAVLAISRLAHAGCTAGELKVTAFNGRLFAPVHSAAFERTRIDDRVMGAAVMAVGTTAVTASDAHGSPTGTWTSSSSAPCTSACSTTSRLRLGACPLTRTGDARRVERHVLHPARLSPRSWSGKRSNRLSAIGLRSRSCESADPRSRNGQRRVPGRGLPLSRRCGRRASRSRGPVAPQATSTPPTVPHCAARSRSAACSAST